MKAREGVGTGELVPVMEPGPVVHVGNGGRDVELHRNLLGILGRHAARRPTLNRAAVAVLTRALLVIFTFILIVVLAQIALVAARTRFDHAPIGDILQQAWEGTQDYFSSLFQGSLGEATSTSILGGRRRSMGEVLLDAYPKSMLLVGLAVSLATVLGMAVGVVAAATRSRRLRAVLVGSTMAVISLPSFLLAILLILLSAEMVRRYNIRLWPSFGFGVDDHLILPTLVLAARPFAQIASFAFVAVDEELGADYVRTARSKGLLERVVIGRHALRNALVPILGAIAAALSIGLSTLPVVEVFFSWPGLGFSLLQAIQRFDAATAGTLLGALVVTIAIVRFALDAAASRLIHASTGAAS
ncbi:MAG: ABC transporter permease [Chloroflexi bacterium]|nr:MAG: ABC transporter permease [Chloroflexota bacterium]